MNFAKKLNPDMIPLLVQTGQKHYVFFHFQSVSERKLHHRYILLGDPGKCQFPAVTHLLGIIISDNRLTLLSGMNFISNHNDVGIITLT